MKILAIESSCDETAAAVVENGRRVLSSVVATQVEEHKLYGGVVPEIASRRHSEAIVGVVREALERAELTVNDLDAIGVTYAPGLIGALLVGVNFAKGLSLSANLPLIPVHHLRSHIASNYITNPELEPPFLCLVVSGGHTHIIEVTDYTKLRILGKTRDDAAGEAFDKAARAMGMPYPGGIAMDKLAETGNDKAFNDNHGSTFGGAGEDMQRDAQQFPPTVYDSMTGNHGASGTATWRQMLENGFVHDTDGFLLDGENSCWS